MKNSEQKSVAEIYVSTAYIPHQNCTPDGFDKHLEREEKELANLGDEKYIQSLCNNGCITLKTKSKLLAHAGLKHDEISAAD